MRISALDQRHRVMVLVVIVAIAAGAGIAVLVGRDGATNTTTIGAKGGVATSSSGSVTSSFAAGEFAVDTDIEIVEDDRRAPLLPPGFVPVVPPVSITPKDAGGHRGIVSIRYENLPDSIPPESIVMSVSDDSKTWESLKTTVDHDTHTLTAETPHFSFFAGWIPSPADVWDLAGETGNAVADAGRAAGGAALDAGRDVIGGVAAGTSWTWNQVQDAGSWLQERQRQFVDLIRDGLTDVLVTLAGGTTKGPDCQNPVNDWRFTAPSPFMNVTALDGCAERRSVDGTWDIAVVNHLPVPYLVALPDGVNVDWKQLLLAGGSIEDTIIAFIELQFGKVMLFGGQQLDLTILNGAPGSINMEGYVDPYSMGLKVAMLVLTVVTIARSAEVKAKLDAALDSARKGINDVVTKTFEDLTGKLPAGRYADEPPILRQLIQENMSSDAGKRGKTKADLIGQGLDSPAVDTALMIWDVANCGASVQRRMFDNASEVITRGVGLKKALTMVQDFVRDMVTECLPVIGEQLGGQMGGDRGEIIKAVGGQLQNVARIGTAEVLAKLQIGTDIDFLQTNIQMDRDPADPGSDPNAQTPAPEAPTSETGTPTTPTPPQPTATETPPPTPTMIPFQTPSGNIKCSYPYSDGDGLMCVIFQHSFNADELVTGVTPWYCGTQGTTVNINQTGAPQVALCAPEHLLRDTQTESATFSGIFTLDYGSNMRRDGVECTSSESGLRCINLDNHGFTLSRAELAAF